MACADPENSFGGGEWGWGGGGGPSDNFVCRVWRDGERMQFVFFGNSTI